MPEFQGPRIEDSTDDDNAVIGAPATVTAASAAVFVLWCTDLAFTGSSVSVFGWEMKGNFADGLFWLLVIDPIVITAAYWISLAVFLVSRSAAAISRRISAAQGAPDLAARSS